MTLDPLLDEFRRQVEALRTQAAFARILKKGEIHLGALKTEDIAALMRDDTAYYFLMAAAGLNRTRLRKAGRDIAGIIASGVLLAQLVRI